MSNLEVRLKSPISAFRKIAIGTWQTAYAPSIYGTLSLRMEPALRYIEEFRQKTGKKLTVTHLVVKALALALRETPDANAILRWNRIYLRKSVDIAVLVVMEDKGEVDLSAATLRGVDQKSLLQIVGELEEHAGRIRARKDRNLEATRQSMGLVPFLFINAFLKLLSFLLYTLNLDLSRFGVPRDAFGSAAVTSIGSLGLDVGYVPLVPYSRVPIWVAPGEVRDEAVVEDGKVVPGRAMSINATFDHRIIDGAHASRLARSLRRIFADPFGNLDPLTPPAPPAG